MGDDTPRYDKRIHALVSERQHNEWKGLTEGDDAPYESISHLVRVAVQREIADENPAKSGGELPTDFQETVMDMADTIESVDSRLSSVERRLSRVEVESDEDALDLQERILNALPTDRGKDDTELSKWAMSLPEVTSVVGSDKETVENVLDQLAEETGTVQRRYGGESAQKWYYRRN